MPCINNPCNSNIYIENKSDMRKSYRGLFRPTNPKKYVGDTKQIVYRSLLERRFMRSKGGRPVHTKLTVNFIEDRIITKSDIEEGA